MAPYFALCALLGVAIFALSPDPRLLSPTALLPEKTALFFLLVCFLVALAPPLHRKLRDNRDACTFALLAAFFILFHLADRAGPRDGWALRFPFLPEDEFSVSYALRVVVLGAIASFPAWFKGDGGPQKWVWSALFLVGILGIGSFWFLAQFFEIGVGKTLDLSPLPPFLLQILGFGALGALCRAATATPVLRGAVLRALPLVLALVLATLQLFPAPLPIEEDDE